MSEERLHSEIESSGKFVCPACALEQDYHRVTVWRGDDEVGGYVECQECFTTWPHQVLDPRTERRDEPLHLEACLEAMLRMMVVDGDIADSEVERIARAYAHVGGSSLEADEIRRRASGVDEGDDVRDFSRRIAPSLNEHGKMAVLRSAWEVATADGVIHDEERRLMRTLVDALDMESDPFAGTTAGGG